jgi:predicted nucleotidyltransferase
MSSRDPALEKQIIDFLKPFGFTKIAIFGSYARNEFNPNSDIDILVRLPERGKAAVVGLRWFSLDQELSVLLGRKVDLVTEASLTPQIRKEIERNHHVLYEKAG